MIGELLRNMGNKGKEDKEINKRNKEREGFHGEREWEGGGNSGRECERDRG